MNEVKIIADPAETVYISTKDHSYGIFCYNSKGDLFLSSDWGMYGFAWRSFGDNFKRFLSGCNADYIFDKFDLNTKYLFTKGLPKHVRPHVIALLNEFINHLKNNP